MSEPAKTEVSIRDYGPIDRADVQLRPLTVFVGPSNTGKTYLATLIYALHRIFSGFNQLPFVRFQPYRPGYPLLGRRSYRNAVLTDKDYEFFADLIPDPHHTAYNDLPPCIKHHIEQDTKRNLLSNLLTSELSRLYDIDTLSDLTNAHNSANSASIAVSIYNRMQNSPDDQQEMLLWKVTGTISDSELQTNLSFSDGPIYISGSIDPEDFEYLQQYITEERKIRSDKQIGSDMLLDHLFNRIVPDSGSKNSWFLPAARSGIMQSHLVISSAIVGMSTRGGLQPLPEIPTLPGAISDFLSNLLLLRNRRVGRRVHSKHRHIQNGHDVVDLIAQSMLDGDVKLQHNNANSYPEFVYSPRGYPVDLPLNRASAMVAELAPLVLFLRDKVHTGDLLVIEEPEAHLHPAAQTHMANAIARIVRMGVDVVVTTHSDWMIQALGNLVRKGELQAKHDYAGPTGSQDDWLLAEEMGVWGFKHETPRGSVVNEIPFDWVDGVDPPEFNDVVDQLYNDTASLYNKHQESKIGGEIDGASNS